MFEGGRKFNLAIYGIVCITLLGVLRVPEVAAISLAIAGIVGTFNGAHAIQDKANAAAGKAGG